MSLIHVNKSQHSISSIQNSFLVFSNSYILLYHNVGLVNIIIVFEKYASHICSYTRRYITLFIRMISVYAFSLVRTPLLHIYKYRSRQRGRRGSFKPLAFLSDYAGVTHNTNKYSRTACVTTHVFMPACFIHSLSL